MHLPIKVIRQPPIIIQSAQIRAANITDLEFLMAGRARGIAQGFEFALFFFFCGFGDANFVVFGYGEGDLGGVA